MKHPTHPVRGTGATSVKPGLTRPLTSGERRRAQRVLLRVPVRLTVAGQEQRVEAETQQGTELTIENAFNEKKIEAHVVRPP